MAVQTLPLLKVKTARKHYCDRLRRPFTLCMSLCYHGLGFSGVQIILIEKKDYLPKKEVEMAVLYDPRIIVPDFRHH